MATRAWCFYIPQAQDTSKHGGFIPSVVFENESGHYPLSGDGEFAQPWIWGSTFEEAQATCNAANELRGVSREQVQRIVLSSMRATRARDNRN